MTDAPKPGSPLSLPPVERIAEELEGAEAAASRHEAEDPELAAMADAFVAETLDDRGEGGPSRQRRAVDEMGLELQQQAARQSEMLKTPLRQLAEHGEEGGPVAKALVELRERMGALDPRHHRLTPGPLDRVLRLLPGVGSRLQRYFHRFETAQQALEAIIADLEGGRDMLARDNLTLADDQEAMRQTLVQLQRQVALGRLIDRRLERALPEIVDASRRAFVEEELLFPLRQRILDLQQQQAVCQQGVLALEVIIRNNRELMRGVDRAINVTVSALSVAATVALALANQRLVLDRIESLNAATSETIAGTARALRQQGVDIQTRAASANLDLEALEGAFADVMAAIEDLSHYRRDALPRLAEQIDRLEVLSREGQTAIDRLECDGGEAAERAS
ncbi:toxic anion resistance protein [Halomonas sp. M4R1S46]|uniref:toxic anion resistance protein n=1 Tax=Halomonas sp. M4R1S46 TaxID=2982692 RepID=UPI0021E3A6A2|nr:toxic anion resistance protein [Halomonas sp. M4R1S46]UYG07402.1 toxic anion resistance protein [Halomonas sp. M4R1S46]